MKKTKEQAMCSFRISSRRLQFLRPGLRELIVAMENVRAKNQLSIVLPPLKCNTGAYSKMYRNTLRRIWATVESTRQQPPASGKVRLRLDCFCVSACQLAARVALRHSTNKGERRAISSLLEQLEAWRKSALRVYLRERGTRSYVQARARWQKFVRWVRTGPLRETPKRFLRLDGKVDQRRYTPLRDHRKVELAMAQAIRQLTNRGEAVPPKEKLREFVRGAFGKVRRNVRRAVSIRDLISTPAGAQFLGEYILRKIGVIK